MTDRSPAHNALMNYQQADEDGVMALVSRQAIHEVSDEIDHLRKRDAEQVRMIQSINPLYR